MSRRLRVYGWQGYRHECPGHNRVTREIVAAHSKAEVARIAGASGPWVLFNLSETGNAREIEVASASPGIIFWKPIDHHNDEWRKGATR